MAIKPEYALTEFYVSLVTYTILHMIFVISGDFVEAFNIPPLNIGIYVDKLAAIRALLMVIADILEWAITQKGFQDPGAFNKLSDSKAVRRQGSVLSFFAMWLCRLVYLWLVYKSDNKSLSVFITLCVEGFWFGVFQMSFFAVGPEYNAFTSLAIHTMGNFIFFTQVILNKLSKSYPYINCLYRVRVHAWVCLITSTISLGPWVWFCNEYIKGDTDQYRELVEEMLAVCADSTNNTAENIAQKFAEAVKDGAPKFKELVKALNSHVSSNLTAETLKNALNNKKQEIKELLEAQFSVKVTTPDNQIGVTKESDNTKVTVSIKNTSQSDGSNTETVTVNGTPAFSLEVKVHEELVTNSETDEKKKAKAKEIAGNLANRIKKAAEKAKIASTYNPGKDLVKEEFGADVTNVTATGKNVTVQIGSSAETERGKATVNVKKETESETQTITIEVKSKNESDIARATARRIARRLAKSMIDFQVSGALKSKSITTSIDQKIDQVNVWSPFLLFIIGAFAEDFSVPGVLPFAFLDPDKANLVNYLTPSFFMTGAFIILILNDFFSAEQSLFGKTMKDIDSQFKEWSENEEEGVYWHGLWFLNVPKYLAFFIAMWSIHGTYDCLRCIIQSRWRVLLLTMFVVVPRATLEVAGYVGVANFAIAQGETGDFTGFDFIAYHDMLAMFCRFVYGKFAVGYNSNNYKLL